MQKFELKSTPDYKLFKYFDYNRIIKSAKVRKLTTEIGRDGLLVPIIVDNRGRIIDGQHRLKALEALGLRVWYLVANHYKQEDLIAINNTQTIWTAPDFLHKEAQNGNLEYGKLLELIEFHADTYSQSMVLKMFAEDNRRDKGTIQSLKYKLDQDKGNNTMQYLQELIEIGFDRKQIIESRFIDALSAIIVENPNYDNEVLLKGLYNIPLRGYKKTADIAYNLVAVYNSEATGRNKIRYKGKFKL